MSSKLGYGAVLSLLTWQQATTVAAALGFASALLGFVFHSDTPLELDRAGFDMSFLDFKMVLKRLAKSPQFWLAAAATTSCAIIKRTIETMGGPLLYMTHTIGF